MPTFNGEHFVRAQLESIYSQTVLPDEVLVVDDASTDETVSVVLDFAQVENIRTLRVLHSVHHLGLVDNVSRGLVAASGEIIFLCDQDDVWYPERVERYIDAFSSSPEVDLIYSDAARVDELLRPEGRSQWEQTGLVDASFRAEMEAGHRSGELLYRRCMTGMTMAISRRLASVAIPIPVSDLTIHDRWLALLAASAGRVISIPEDLALYRIHPGQWSQIDLTRTSLLGPPSRHRMDPAWISDPTELEAARLANETLKRSIDRGYELTGQSVGELTAAAMLGRGRASSLLGARSGCKALFQAASNGAYTHAGRRRFSLLRDLVESLLCTVPAVRRDLKQRFPDWFEAASWFRSGEMPRDGVPPWMAGASPRDTHGRNVQTLTPGHLDREFK